MSYNSMCVEDSGIVIVPADYSDDLDVHSGFYDGINKIDVNSGKDWVPPELFKCNGLKSRRVVMTRLKPQPQHTEEELALANVAKPKTRVIVPGPDSDLSLAQKISWGSFKIERTEKL
jgi:hypothetical protein